MQHRVRPLHAWTARGGIMGPLGGAPAVVIRGDETVPQQPGSQAVVHSNPDVPPAPRRRISGFSWEKSMTVVGSVPQSPESITASTA